MCLCAHIGSFKSFFILNVRAGRDAQLLNILIYICSAQCRNLDNSGIVLRKVGIPTLPIPELYRTILELCKGYISYYSQIWSLRRVGIGMDKVRI